MDSAMAEGCEEMAAISARWLLRNFQATKERMAVITTIFTTVTICCLENRLVRPDSGLRRLNCGWVGLRLRIHPPARLPATTAAPRVTAGTTTGKKLESAHRYPQLPVITVCRLFLDKKNISRSN